MKAEIDLTADSERVRRVDVGYLTVPEVKSQKEQN
jgi:hypothetical protein